LISKKSRGTQPLVNTKLKGRGIFAVEGEWHLDLRMGFNFRPILDLMATLNHCPYVHRDAATREELFYYLDKWVQRRYEDYPILYLGFHGLSESILIGDARKLDCLVSLDELMERLAGKCEKRILFFGSCETMRVDRRRLTKFLRQTGALAVCGYREKVDMLKSAAFELLLFNALSKNTLTIQGAKAMRRNIESNEKRLCHELGFRMLVRESIQ
jgi:hypothetical protein